MGAPRLSIGDVSKRTGCKAETIRYYERIGVLPPPPRSAGGHRHYGSDQVKRLTFILRARKLGFPLNAVRALLRLADGDENSCAEVEHIAAAHLGEVRDKLGDLAVLEGVLAGMVARCRGGVVPDCPIIEALFEGD
jgi:MerR family mercuric resistance operon transcriptional regulator